MVCSPAGSLTKLLRWFAGFPSAQMYASSGETFTNTSPIGLGLSSPDLELDWARNNPALPASNTAINKQRRSSIFIAPPSAWLQLVTEQLGAQTFRSTLFILSVRVRKAGFTSGQRDRWLSRGENSPARSGAKLK